MLNDRSEELWYPLRVTYSREMKVRDMLEAEGLSCFIPMTLRVEEKGGIRSSRIVPAVSNLCFVKTSRPVLDRILEDKGMRGYVSYMWDKATREPSIVPDKAMADFIRVSESRLDDILYLYEVSSKLRTGQKVRIKNGPLAGVEGVVVRVKRSRRVMVELPGMLAVATGYIPEEELEILI